MFQTSGSLPNGPPRDLEIPLSIAGLVHLQFAAMNDDDHRFTSGPLTFRQANAACPHDVWHTPFCFTFEDFDTEFI